jgi:SpoVK/Ycf46/Vps4 family AAA+-type ATPase
MEARLYILQALVQDRPIADLDLKSVSEATSLFSGADLRTLIEQAFDLVIEEILKSQDDRALQMTHIRTVLSKYAPRHSRLAQPREELCRVRQPERALFGRGPIPPHTRSQEMEDLANACREEAN